MIGRALCLAAMAAAATAGAAEPPRISAQLWASSLEGSTRFGVVSIPIEASFAELFEVFDGGLMLRYEHGGDGWGFYGEALLNDLKHSSQIPGGIAQVNARQLIVELGLRRPLAAQWDVYGGLRHQEMDNSVDFTSAPSQGAGATWQDLLVGARWHLEEGAWRGWARGDWGGGSSSPWLLEAGAAWRFAPRWELLVSYRVLESDYSDAGFAWDVSQSGMIIGMSHAFADATED